MLGVVAGAGGMLVAFPYLFPLPVVNESVDAMAVNAEAIGETRFREGVSGQDAVHWGRGGVKWYRTERGTVLVELQADFEIGAGPNYWIYLNTRTDIDDEDGFLADIGRIKWAKIKSFTGSQVYEVDMTRFMRARAVTIWCETFDQYIASANLVSS